MVARRHLLQDAVGDEGGHVAGGLAVERVEAAHLLVEGLHVEPGFSGKRLALVIGQEHLAPPRGRGARTGEAVVAVEQPPEVAGPDPPVARRLDLKPRCDGLDHADVAGRGEKSTKSTSKPAAKSRPATRSATEPTGTPLVSGRDENSTSERTASTGSSRRWRISPAPKPIKSTDSRRDLSSSCSRVADLRARPM